MEQVKPTEILHKTDKTKKVEKKLLKNTKNHY